MIGCWRKPYIDVESNLTAGMAIKHRTAARLGHVADQDAVPTNLLGAPSKPVDECDESWIAPISVAGDAHNLPTWANDR